MGNFDAAAMRYDQSFTHTLIGTAQRKRVRTIVEKLLVGNRIEKILEINCGTGEDAIWLANQGVSIVATDLSPHMVAQAQSKPHPENLHFATADINELPKPLIGEQFDLIFSNFGGLNCLSSVRLELFFKNAASMLKQKGKLLLVLMPRQTKWEQAYFLTKTDLSQAFRRKKDGVTAIVDGENVSTYYYNPSEVVAMADTYFLCDQINPIGFFVPPSYLEPYFSRRRKLFWILDRLESRVQNMPRLAPHSDHYCIEFTKR